MTTERRPSLRHPLLWATVAGLVVADLALKSWAFAAVPPGEVHPLAGNWLSVRCITNPGGVWGLGQGLTPVLTVIRMFAVAAMVWLVGRQPPDNRRGLATLGALLAGAVGNLYDNLSAWLPWPGNGEVRDFVQVYFVEPGWWPGFLGWPFDPWPIFNLADALIVCGFVALLTGLAHLQVKPPGEGEDAADADGEADRPRG